MAAYPPSPSYFGAANGRYRATLAQASSGAANAAYSTYVGTLAASTVEATRAPPLEDAGIRAGEIIGYRAWLLMEDGLLHGMFMTDYAWKPRAVEHSPKVDARWGAGLHAFKDLKEARSQYFYYGEYPVVLGEVSLWGEVIEHEKGFRAEYAAIRDLLVLDDGYFKHRVRWAFWKPTKLALLRERYGIGTS